MITGEQLRAGRAMLGWEQSELAGKADVSLKTIKRMEATSGRIDARSISSVKNALEIAGIEFLNGDGDWRTRGDGVRFFKDRTAKLRLAIVEAVTFSLDYDLKEISDDDEDFFERPIGEVVEKVVNKMRDGLTDKLQVSCNGMHRLRRRVLKAQPDFTARVGEALLQIQSAEQALKLCMKKYVRPIGMSWEEIARLEEKERTRTLGYFVGELQKRIEIRSNFVDLLSQFVKDRNTFVHDLSEVPGFDLQSEDGQRAGLQFVSSLSERASLVGGVLMALIRVLEGNDKLQQGEPIGPGIGPEHEDQMYELLAIGAFLQSGL